MKIVVIIPTYNERENIEKTIKGLQGVFKTIRNHECHILVVDGNSPDGTANVVRNLIKNSRNIHLVVEKEKRGLGAAYVEAMNYAFNVMKASAVIMMDADLSHDIRVIPKFVERLEKGAKYVCGTRYRKGGGIPPEWGIHRKLLSIGGNWFIRLLYFGSGLSDFTSGFKAFTKEVYNEIKDNIGVHGGYTFAISANLEPIRKGFRPIEVPYHFKDRTHGESKMGSEYFRNALIFVLKSRFGDFLNTRFGKVFLAGGMGATAQLLIYGLFFYPLVEGVNIFNLSLEVVVLGFKIFPRFLISQVLAIEIGLFVSFFVNNMWAFADRKLYGVKFVKGYLKNHLVVLGAIFIQIVVAQLLAYVFGVGLVRNYVYQSIGILVGLIWNFHFYKKLIWRISK